MSVTVVRQRKEWRLWTGALTIAAFGTLLVMGVVIGLNVWTSMPEKEEALHPVTMEVVAPPKPKPKKKVKKTRKRMRKQRLKPVPTPNLGADLSGIDFGMPDVGMDGFGVDDDLLGDTSVSAMTQDTVDAPPQAVVTGGFRYPPAAKKKGVQGYVVLSVLVDETGAIQDVRLIESSPPEIFDQSAMEGIRRWRFKPAQYQGKPVKVWVQQKIVFRLD